MTGNVFWLNWDCSIVEILKTYPPKMILNVDFVLKLSNYRSLKRIVFLKWILKNLSTILHYQFNYHTSPVTPFKVVQDYNDYNEITMTVTWGKQKNQCLGSISLWCGYGSGSWIRTGEKMDPDPGPFYKTYWFFLTKQNFQIFCLIFSLIFMLKLDEPFRNQEIFITSL